MGIADCNRDMFLGLLVQKIRDEFLLPALAEVSLIWEDHEFGPQDMDKPLGLVGLDLKVGAQLPFPLPNKPFSVEVIDPAGNHVCISELLPSTSLSSLLHA